jgi:hypothetical protein
MKNFDVEVPFGEQAYLGMMPVGGAAPFEMTFMGNDALKSVFKQVLMQGTNEYLTDVLKLTGFDINAYINEFLCGNKNNRWDEHNIKVYFNPDNCSGGTGKRLSLDYINAVKDETIERQKYSEGFISPLTDSDFIENGNKPSGQRPPDGEIWVFYASDIQSVGNIAYPGGGNAVKSGILLINPVNASIPNMLNELRNLFIDLDQPSWAWTRNFNKFYRASFRRPAGNNYNYRVYTDHEEQEDFSGTTIPSGYELVQLIPETDPMSGLNLDNRREMKYRVEERHIPVRKEASKSF